MPTGSWISSPIVLRASVAGRPDRMPRTIRSRPSGSSSVNFLTRPEIRRCRARLGRPMPAATPRPALIQKENPRARVRPSVVRMPTPTQISRKSPILSRQPLRSRRWRRIPTLGIRRLISRSRLAIELLLWLRRTLSTGAWSPATATRLPRGPACRRSSRRRMRRSSLWNKFNDRIATRPTISRLTPKTVAERRLGSCAICRTSAFMSSWPAGARGRGRNRRRAWQSAAAPRST